ncbi:hypothetical protein J4214_03675 [Candidatus Woesearchaeota archaeon]|nr:hypothetical protein [Candidatus Woesearchaeota archaeon]
MVRLSEKTRLALKADISSILYENPLKAMFTKEIAFELRRDKEFTKQLLIEMEKNGLVERIVKNMKGKKYEKRVKWRIPQNMLKFYKEIS